MGKPWKPVLGERVRFTQYMVKWAAAEYNEALEDGQETIEAKFLPNPEFDNLAMVIGRVSKSIAAKSARADGPLWGDEVANDHYIWDPKKRRTFYILKKTIRGRQFHVPIEDLRPPTDPDPWPEEALLLAAAGGLTVQVIAGCVFGKCPYCDSKGVRLHPDDTHVEAFVCSDCMK